MPTLYAELGLERLSVEQRLALIDEIWDSLPDDVDPMDAIPEHHREEIERRYAEAIANPGLDRPWREVVSELGKKK